MGEYGREQRNQLSRTVVNNEGENAQLKKNIDRRNSFLLQNKMANSILVKENYRYYTLQRAQNLPQSYALQLSALRLACEDTLWSEGSRNQEVQVAIDNSGVLIISYNLGLDESCAPPSMPSSGLFSEIQRKYIEIVQAKNIANVVTWRADRVQPKGINIVDVRVLTSNRFPPPDKVEHAEMRIVYQMAIDILRDQNKNAVRKILLRGKKFTCPGCRGALNYIDSNPILNQHLIIHRPNLEVFNATKMEGDENVGVRSSIPSSWINPFFSFQRLDDIKRDYQIDDNDKSKDEFIVELIRLGTTSFH